MSSPRPCSQPSNISSTSSPCQKPGHPNKSHTPNSQLQWHPIVPPATGKPQCSTSTPPSSQGTGECSIQEQWTIGSPLKLTPKKLITARLAGSSLKWCLRAKTGRLARPSLTMVPSPWEPKMPQQVLDANGTTIKSENNFWHFGVELSDVHQLPDEVIPSLNTLHYLPHQPVQIHSPWKPGDAQNHGPATCHEVAWSQGLDPIPRPVTADLQGPYLPLPAAWVPVQAVPNGQGEGPDRPHLPHHSDLLSIFYSSNALSTFPNCSRGGYYTHPPPINTQLKAESATTAGARTITLPCLGTAEDPNDPPVTPDNPSIQEDCPGEKSGQGTTYQTTGTDPPDPPSPGRCSNHSLSHSPSCSPPLLVQ